MALDLFSHNAEAYDAVVKMLQEKGRAAVIHPTGTGKSFIAFKLCEDNRDKTICWISPSEYIFRTQLENLAAVSEDYKPENIKFFTYARLMNMTAEEISAIDPDYIILDEFHRCGARMWGTGVQLLLDRYAGVPVLGLSATSVRYLDNQRDMADELFDGNVASHMTLGEAIVRGILNTPKYILSIFSYKENLEKYETRIQAQRNRAVKDRAEQIIESLRRALNMAEGLDVIFDRHMENRTGKYIVFTANFEAMQDAVDNVPDWFGKVDSSPHVYTVYSDDPASSQSFQDFKADEDKGHLRLLFCIDALNEGVHVENISGVILMRPTVSPTVFKQQIGRALSASKNTVPVIFDIVNNIENLYSIDSVKEEIHAAITYYRYTGDNSLVVNETFEVTDEVADCRRLFEELEGTLSAGWDIMFEKAAEYRELYGDLMIPAKYITADGYALGNWLTAQRKCYFGKGSRKLTQAEISKLESLGIVWESHLDHVWEQYFTEAEKYFERYGDLKVPNSYVTDNGLKLGIWIQRMRSAKTDERLGVLTREKQERLEKIGMVWSAVSAQWEENYTEAVHYYNEHGNLDIPSKYITESGVKLGNWIVHLRQKRAGTDSGMPLTDEQIARLDRIGMIWNTDQYRFDVGFEHAERYYRKNGNLKVPATYICEDDGYSLGMWINLKRRQYKKGTLSAENIRRLEKLDIVWSARQKKN